LFLIKTHANPVNKNPTGFKFAGKLEIVSSFNASSETPPL
jgi:hypothetical protein